MKHSVCVITGSRAEFGLLRPLLARLDADAKIDLRLTVTGSHLSPSFGNTQDEITASGLMIHRRIAIPIEGDTRLDMAKATSIALRQFSEYFAAYRADLVIVLGDRYEIFAASLAAAMLGIPIAHLHGGETTEGAMDEFFRHSITKMSTLHFTCCEAYRRRVIQLGEAPERVFNVGSLGVENIMTLPLMTRKELQESLNFSIEKRPFSVVTFHPVTMEENTIDMQMHELIQAMDCFPEMQYIITLANADAEGRKVNARWQTEAAGRKNWHVVSSLGSQRYLSALKHAEMMIGNSSSGILEGPSMHIPTINIGDRQKGRIMAESVISCAPVCSEISTAMNRALTEDFRAIVRRVTSPFGDGTASKKMMHIILDFLKKPHKNLKKTFYDIRFEVQ